MAINFGDGTPPGGPTTSSGAGATSTTGAITTSSSDYVVPVANGTAFPNGTYAYINDGTNSVLAPVKSGGGTNTLTLDHTLATTTGTVTSIATGTTVTFGGKTGATGATGATGPTGPAGSPATLAFQQVQSLPLTISDTSVHTICQATVTVTAGQKVKITACIAYKYGIAGDGLHATIQESSTIVYPTDGSTGPDWLVKQTADFEWFTLMGVLTPSAGSHTYALAVADAIGAANAVINDGFITAEVYS